MPQSGQPILKKCIGIFPFPPPEPFARIVLHLTQTPFSSFESDTGLKKATETVEDYTKLMKDFPIKQLLLASDMESLRNAIINIFGHFRKIRNTTYPAMRAQKLSQAISRDLRERMLSLLSERNLLDISYVVMRFLLIDFAAYVLPETNRLHMHTSLTLYLCPHNLAIFSSTLNSGPFTLTHTPIGTPTFRAWWKAAPVCLQSGRISLTSI